MAGVILILLGLTGLGTAVKYIPRPVVIGFTNGIGVLIASTQIRDLFGLQIAAHARRLPRPAAGPRSPVPAPRPVIATLFGLGTIAVILMLRTVSRRIPGSIIVLLAGSAVGAGLRRRPRDDRHPIRRRARAGCLDSTCPRSDSTSR